MIFDFLQGKKTYIIAAAGVIWGLYTHDYSTVFVALGLVGLRNGLSSELKKLIQPEEKTQPEQPVVEAPIDPNASGLPVETPIEPQVFG